MMQLVPFRRSVDAAEPSDESLLVACAAGDRVALGTLFDRHHDAVRRFLARLSGTDDRDLDDLLQATFQEVPRAASKFDRRAQVKTWLFGVARNIARHHVRSETRRKRHTEAAGDLEPTAGDAGADVIARERSARLHRAILELPEALREAFVLVYLEGLSGSEVAGMIGAREGTVWKRLHQARARLRVALEGVYP